MLQSKTGCPRATGNQGSVPPNRRQLYQQIAGLEESDLGQPGPPLTRMYSSALQHISDVRVRAVFKPLGMTAFERYADISSVRHGRQILGTGRF
jgi:hypothetical protein